jgi:hypothetical protein
MSAQFKFEAGTKIKDKEINDVRLIVGRVLDVDDGNNPLYIVNKDGRIDWMTAKALEENFEDVEASLPVWEGYNKWRAELVD